MTNEPLTRKQKISRALLRYWEQLTPEQRAERGRTFSAALSGRVISAETRAKMRAAKLGRKFTPEHRAALKAAHARRKKQPTPQGD